MKIGVFTDAHYCTADVLCDTRRPSLSLSKIREAMEAFARESVDFCICLGDITDHAPSDTKESIAACLHEALTLIKSYEIPFFLVPGNHDYLVTTREDFESLGIKIPPHAHYADGYRFIFLDANYRSDGRCFDAAGVEWTDSNLPEDQLSFLQEALEESTHPCIVLIHENLDPFVDALHIVKNAEKARKIIKGSGKVKLVLQGHFHPGAEHTVDGIPYVTIPALCEGESNSYRIFTF